MLQNTVFGCRVRYLSCTRLDLLSHEHYFKLRYLGSVNDEMEEGNCRTRGRQQQSQTQGLITAGLRSRIAVALLCYYLSRKTQI